MDWKVMVEVCMGIIFFAPLLIALLGFLFIGAMMVFEGIAQIAMASEMVQEKVVDAQKHDGPIVSGLKESIEDESNHTSKKIAK